MVLLDKERLGDILAKTKGEYVETLPMPTYDGEDLSENYIFMGWTESKPKDEGYYKLDPDCKMKTYEFGIIYIREEDKFQMQEIDSAFDYIPDETNTSVIYSKDTTPISVFASYFVLLS